MKSKTTVEVDKLSDTVIDGKVLNRCYGRALGKFEFGQLD